MEDREKEICAKIDKLQNQKIKIIFTQVKKRDKKRKIKYNVSVYSAFIGSFKKKSSDSFRLGNDCRNQLIAESGK